MVKPLPGEDPAHSDPNKPYLATYVDEEHAIFFDDADETPYEVAKIGPASASDRDVAIVKYTQALPFDLPWDALPISLPLVPRGRYTQALQQCVSLRTADASELVAEAFAEVKEEMGGSLGPKDTINFLASAGEEARAGQLLCEALVSNLGALWDESRSVLYMMRAWRETCEAADADKSGTISEEEAVQMWESVLASFTQFVQGKMEALGVHKNKVAQRL